MLIRIRRTSEVKPSEITPLSVYRNRRQFLKAASATGAVAALSSWAPARAARAKLEGVVKGPYATDEEKTPYDAITTYNNFYEFGSDKDEPAKHARFMHTRPWSITVDGEVAKPGTYTYEDLVKPHRLEERIYRLRCVEAWSMVVPWVGIPLADMIRRFEPTSRAKYVAFRTLLDPKQMPGQQSSILPWPYVEGLRMDEALHPLTLMVVGLYGEELPNQNGAPLRLMAPWKYGFKNIKSIVAFSFVEDQPRNTWNVAAPNEYGFYANVNPEVDHPRWSQARERRIGEFLRRPTLMFNGYGEEVAGLYAGMDLRKLY